MKDKLILCEGNSLSENPVLCFYKLFCCKESQLFVPNSLCSLPYRTEQLNCAVSFRFISGFSHIIMAKPYEFNWQKSVPCFMQDGAVFDRYEEVRGQLDNVPLPFPAFSRCGKCYKNISFFLKILHK